MSTVINTDDVIVVVHPSFPWESRGDLPPSEREWHLQKCGLVLNRIAEAVSIPPMGNRIIVGPYLRFASYLPELVSNDLDVLEKAVPAMNIHGRRYGVRELSEAAESVAEQIRRLRNIQRVVITGFYRDICCLQVANRIAEVIPSASVHLSKNLTG